MSNTYFGIDIVHYVFLFLFLLLVFFCRLLSLIDDSEG